MTYPHNLKLEYPEDYSFKKPILVAFSDDPHNPITFFAGLGTPWKISPSVEFATIVRNTHQQKSYAAGLFRTYELTFTVMEMEDALVHDYSCSICAYSWSEQDSQYAKSILLVPTTITVARDQLTIGSPFHNCSSEERKEHTQRILGSRICTNESCRRLSCGSDECRIIPRGKGAKLCIPCRKARTTRINRRGQ